MEERRSFALEEELREALEALRRTDELTRKNRELLKERQDEPAHE